MKKKITGKKIIGMVSALVIAVAGIIIFKIKRKGM